MSLVDEFDAYSGKDTISKRAMRRGNQALTVAIIALILGTIGTAVAFYNLTHPPAAGGNSTIIVNGTDYQPQLDELQLEIDDLVNNATMQNAQIQLLFAQLSEVLLNTTQPDQINITQIQAGTFRFRRSGFSDTTDTDPTPYTIDNVQIGPLSFNVLNIPGPTQTVPIFGNDQAVYMQNFSPPIQQLVPQASFNGNAPYYFLPLTASNAAKLRVDAPIPACFDEGNCYPCVFTGDTELVTKNAVAVTCTSNCLLPSSFSILFTIRANFGSADGAITGKTVEFLAPLQLILPAV